VSLVIEALPGVPPAQLGESPFWHPGEGVLYWCDIPGRRVHRFDPRDGRHVQWPFDAEPGCVAPLATGGLVVACRDGLWRFDPADGARERLCTAPYDTSIERFNDGKADPQGRLWVGTIDEAREPRASLYRWIPGGLDRMLDGATTSNGLAWSPDGRTLYWSDTPRHEVFAFDFDPALGAIAGRRSFARFDRRVPDEPIERYGGRPDGAAVDVEGAYWVAMYEGARVLRLSSGGEVLREIALPAQCPTMPCFGGPDLRTLFITTALAKRPADELDRMPLTGCVLRLRVDVPGLPVNFVHA
jgi:sugar lactone lactonase YvrE